MGESLMLRVGMLNSNFFFIIDDRIVKFNYNSMIGSAYRSDC